MNLIEVNGCDQLKYNLQFVALMCCGHTNMRTALTDRISFD